MVAEGEIHPRLRGALPQISLHQAVARRRRTSRGGAGPRPSSPVHLQLFTLTDSSPAQAWKVVPDWRQSRSASFAP